MQADPAELKEALEQHYNRAPRRVKLFVDAVSARVGGPGSHDLVPGIRTPCLWLWVRT